MSKISQDIRAKTLIIHNEFRSAHNVPPLQWNSQLEKQALDYATNLAVRNLPLAANTDLKYGQNLFELKSRGTKFSSTGEDKVDATERAIRGWYRGVEDFKFGEERPGGSTAGLSFSQMVWKTTKEVGVGVAQSNDNTRIIVIALYDPPGNFNGEFSNNVFQKTTNTTNIRSNTSNLNNTDKYSTLNSNTDKYSTLNSNTDKYSTLNSNNSTLNTTQNTSNNFFNNNDTRTNGNTNNTNTNTNSYIKKTTTTIERSNNIGSDSLSNNPTLDSRFNNVDNNHSSNVHTTTNVIKNWNLNDMPSTQISAPPPSPFDDTTQENNESSTRTVRSYVTKTTTTTSYSSNNETDNFDDFHNVNNGPNSIPIPITNLNNGTNTNTLDTNRRDVHNINRRTTTTTNNTSDLNNTEHNLFDSKVNKNVTTTVTKDVSNYTNSRVLNNDQNQNQHTVKFQLDSPTDFVPGSGAAPGKALELHNQYRRKHGVPSLRLDQKLCDLATEEAKMLLDDKSGRSPPKMSGVGRNIYKLSGSGAGPNGAEQAVVKAIEKWYSHINDYNWNAPLQSQGHSGLFTQVVWKDSQAVGVGIATAEGKAGSRPSTVVVCLYSPGGNIASEQSHRENVFPASR